HGEVFHGTAIPDGLDPDEVLFDQETGAPIREGKERMAAILGAAKPLLDARIDEQIALGSQGPEARTQALKRIGGWLVRFKDPVGRVVRIEAVATKMRISKDLLVQVSEASLARGRGGMGEGGRDLARPAGGSAPVRTSRPMAGPGAPPRPIPKTVPR